MTALLYTWNLARIGMGNDFYAAAVKSGTESWKAFFFGSLDPGSFITVDKPPAALWVMELSGRLFGFSSWSMLLPEALAGVATVMVLYHLVRRWFGEPAAVFASLALALTPVAVVIFRYNDPDAFLTLLLVLAAWGCWRAIETGKTIGLVVAGALVGLAFLTKTLDAFIVVPALGLAYLWCGPPRLARRLGQLGWAALALLVSSGWWVAIVELWPKSARPYIGGSTNNSELNLIFGYNGFARIFGSGGAGAGGGTTSGTSSAFGGGEGLLRMFDNELGGQISWLLPVALVGLVAGLWLTRRHARADGRRAGFVLWGGTLADVPCGVRLCERDLPPVLHGGHGPGDRRTRRRRSRRTVAARATVAALGLGPSRHHCRHRSVGRYPSRPHQRLRHLARAHGRRDRHDCRAHSAAVHGATEGHTLVCAVRGHGCRQSRCWPGRRRTPSRLWTRRRVRSRPPVPHRGPAAWVAGPDPVAGRLRVGRRQVDRRRRHGQDAGAGAARIASASPGGPGGGGGGGGGASTVNESLVKYLEKHQGSATYLVAVNGSQSAAPFILESGKAVIAMGGFGGSDPAPTLSEFKHMVAAGEVHYVYVSGGTGTTGGAGGSGFGGGSAAPGGLRSTASARSTGTTGSETTGSNARSARPTGQGVPPGVSGGSQHTSTASAVDAWVEKYGTKVSSNAYGGSSSGGTLYVISSSAATK